MDFVSIDLIYGLLALFPAWAASLVSGLALLPVAFGAFTNTVVYRSADEVVVDIIASADGDTASGNIAHGLGSIPNVEATKILGFALAAEPGWAVTTTDVTNVVATKLATVGSGNAAAQLRLTIRRRK